MKVALVTNFCPRYRYTLFKILKEKYGFDIYLFERVETTKEDVRHLNVCQANGPFAYLPRGRILHRLLKRRYDAIIKCTNDKWSFLGSLLASKMTGAKFIVWDSLWYFPRTIQYKLFSRPFLHLLKKHAQAIIVYGEHGKRFLGEKGVDIRKIFVARQTTDNELYGRAITRAEEENIKLRFRLGPANVVLYVGRLERFKGLEYLMEAFEILKGRGVRFTFLCIGDGELRMILEKRARDIGLDIIFTGLIKTEELPPYYKLSRLLVLPSITTKKFKEPWGFVVNEAFLQGCPVVVTDSVGAGAGGLVKDGLNGYIVPERDPVLLAEAMGKIMADQSLRNEFSKNARNEIMKWTPESQARGFFEAVEYSLPKS